MKIFNVLCVVSFLVFNCNAIKREAVIANEETALAKASRLLDKAYHGPDREEIDKQENQYKQLVQQDTATVSWPHKSNWPNKTVLNLEQRGLQTQQFIMNIPGRINCSNITELRVSDNNLSDLRLGDWLSSLPNLEKLFAPRNAISHVSTWGISRDCKLEVLDLSDNALTLFDLRSVIKKCKNLKKINLSRNPIQDVVIAKDNSRAVCLPQDLHIYLFSHCLSEDRINTIKKFYGKAIKKQKKSEEVCTFVSSSSGGCIGGGMCYPDLCIGSCLGLSLAAMMTYFCCVADNQEESDETIIRLKNIHFSEEENTQSEEGAVDLSSI